MVGLVRLNLASCIWATDLVRNVHRVQGVIYFTLKSELSANHTTHLGHLELYFKANKEMTE